MLPLPPMPPSHHGQSEGDDHHQQAARVMSTANIEDDPFANEPVQSEKSIDEILVAWTKYYKHPLAKPDARSEASWESSLPTYPRDLATLPDMSADFSTDEVLKAIKSLKRGKAPGMDGITAEFLKVLLPVDDDQDTCEVSVRDVTASLLSPDHRTDMNSKEAALHRGQASSDSLTTIGQPVRPFLHTSSHPYHHLPSRPSSHPCAHLPSHTPSDPPSRSSPSTSCNKTNASNAVVKLINIIWQARHIPEATRTMGLVPIPKPGEAGLRGAVRGISLISVPLRLLTTCVKNRLNSAVEACRLLPESQAGFRTHEECPAQALCLVEAIRVRAAKEMPTYTLSIDFAKAYGTVPHMALMVKLKRLGMQDRMLRFIETLYSNATAQVRLPRGDTSFVYGPRIRIERGLRQGCPLSPLVFNLLIRDLNDRLPHDGVIIPYRMAPMNIKALLYADDVAFLCHSREEAVVVAECTQTWARVNGMQINISKCGVLRSGSMNISDGVVAVNSGGQQMDHLRANWNERAHMADVSSSPSDMAIHSQVSSAPLATASQTPIVIYGQHVPEVQEYTYLVIQIDEQASSKTMMARRVRQGSSALRGLTFVLKDQGVPLDLRLRLLVAVVGPALTYGAELLPYA